MGQLRDHLIDHYQHDFQIQIGINTGAVIAGYMNDQQHLEYTVIGDTVHLASQLQRSTNPGTILVSFSTYQRSRPIFDYQSMPPLQLEGNSGPTRVFQPLGIRLTPGQVRGLPGLQVPMIGRREQLDQLIGVFKQVIGNNTSEIILCSGEAGIGKSRLVAEFRNYLTNHPVTMVRAHAPCTCASRRTGCWLTFCAISWASPNWTRSMSSVRSSSGISSNLAWIAMTFFLT